MFELIITSGKECTTIPCETKEAAQTLLEEHLAIDTLAIARKFGYEPIITKHSDTEVELVYENIRYRIVPAMYSDPRIVETNIGAMPLEDYLEIVSIQSGFDSYKDLKKSGFRIKVRPVIEEAANS